ncbi:MAG: UDP-N-acetylglucosamine 2-epimerase (non-hydrolyzing) [Candidatus Aureabacteria bacterium]|nr:UDP-N-acetylglucosamine 2-epimerase (non-hydrolyzing) [Candidatus Auribacterota bacterium]
MKRIVVLLGTRPEVIKLAPVIKELKRRKRYFKVYVIATGQHREMADSFLKHFNIKVDFNLNIMKENQTLTEITSGILAKFEKEVCDKYHPDLIMVQGDTTTAFTAALAAFYRKIKIAHVEAGLRTSDKYSPFPEEMNRRMISCVADFNFAPTKISAKNLACEGHAGKSVFLTGNTIVDALRAYSRLLGKKIISGPDGCGKMILITMHRRENFGRPSEDVCGAVLKILDKYRDVFFRIPVHPNPNIKRVIEKYFGGNERIIVSGPVAYDEMLRLINSAYIIMTDSGGIQEEAPAFGKPVLVLREKTERPEGVFAGVAKLVGTNSSKIVRSVSSLVDSPAEYRKMAKSRNPYGDGKASSRIADILEKVL